MKKMKLFTFLMMASFFCFYSCSEGADNVATAEEIEEVNEVIEEEVEEVEEEKVDLGNFEGLVGSWTVDAATAGIQMDLTFGEDASFSQKMGTVEGDGTWEVIDEKHINIVTQTTTGQKWKITEVTAKTAKISWNPDAESPKVLPMTRVQ